MNNRSYRLSFTFGGLLVRESRIVVQSFLNTGSWERAREDIEGNNLLQKTRKATSFRYFREIRDRLIAADGWELELIAKGDQEEILPILFVRAALYYRFIADFVIEVVYWKLSAQDYHLHLFELHSFWEKKAEQHMELISLSETTKRKLLQVVLRVLKEMQIITEEVKRNEEFLIRMPVIKQDILEQYAEQKRYDALRLLIWNKADFRRITGVE